jgi:undecaprenyl-diphosphatase
VTPLEAALLGLVQGLTEFLPISSTAHLLIAQEALGVNRPGLHLEIAAHLGTIGSVVVYTRSDLRALLSDLVRGGPGRRLLLLASVGTLPLGLGVLARKQFPEVKAWRDDVRWAALGLAAMGVFLLLTRLARRRGDGEAGVPTAAGMGIAQCISALVPGWSRSGSTIGTGLFLGADPAWAARFSFLLSIPAVVGGSIVDLRDEPLGADADLLPLGVACLVAFASGLAAIHTLLRILRRGNLWWFGPYCLLVGLAARLLVG